MKRSKQNLSHYRLTSLNQGQLYPVACMEVLPGDSFRYSASVLLRVAPLAAPVMHPVNVSLHCWYVPLRLLWDNFEAFITGRDKTKTVPTITFAPGDTNFQKFVQAFGAGVDTVAQTLSALPLRAYNKIYNEYYRDQDLTTPLPERTGDTGDLIADYLIRNVSWEKDYFTTCRPQPQQDAGGEVVPITFNQPNVPVKGIGLVSTFDFPLANPTVRESGGGTAVYPNSANPAAGTNLWRIKGTANPGYPDITADLSGISAGTMSIENWRRSMAIQRLREHRNRFGSRFTDYLAYLGIRSSDGRLDRPEYLGGGKQTLAFSEVLSTADTGSFDVGGMAGHGIAALRTRPYSRFFEENGYIISLLWVRPKTVYRDVVPRHWTRRAYTDFWQKELEMMGDQPVSNLEVWGRSATPTGVFGYIPRFDDYRHEESSVSGEFRSVLNYWHMAREFASQPVLNAAFVAADPTTRIYQSAANDQLYAMVGYRVAARRLVQWRGEK